MTRVTHSYAPYAPPKNVLDFIQRKRERGLPDIITGAVLQQIGIPEGNISRTLRALQFLGLIEEDGRQSAQLERIGAASSSEYPRALADTIRQAYHDVFTVVDPAADSETAISDAFRQYQPAAQRSRMIALFLALCRAAGIVSAAANQSDTGRRKEQLGRQQGLLQPPHPVPTTRRSIDGQTDGESHIETPQVDYRLVSALMQQLPADGKWTRTKRERWLQAVTSAVDLIIEIAGE